MDPIEFQKQLQARLASGHGVKELVRGVADEAHARARTGARVNAVVMGVMLSLFALGLLATAAGAATGTLGWTQNLPAAAGLTLGALATRFGFALRFHPGFRLAATDVPDDFRGPRMPPLAARVVARFADDRRTIDALVIGRAARDLARDAAAWADWDTADEARQHLKQLWHVLVRYGSSG